MSDDYAYHPLLELERPLAIAGYLSHENRLIAYQLASLTGLPVIDLDRKIEHHAGKSIWELIWGEGERRYRQLEREYLGKVLAERPCPIVSLGDGTLIDEANRSLVRSATRLVVLDLDLANCYWRLRASPQGRQEMWHPLHPETLERFEQLRPFWELRAPGFVDADHRIELRGKSRNDVVETLLELIRKQNGQ